MEDQNAVPHESSPSRITWRRTAHYADRPTQTHKQNHFLERVRRAKVDTGDVEFQKTLEETSGTLKIQSSVLQKLAAKENKLGDFVPHKKSGDDEKIEKIREASSDLERARKEAEEVLTILHSTPKT